MTPGSCFCSRHGRIFMDLVDDCSCANMTLPKNWRSCMNQRPELRQQTEGLGCLSENPFINHLLLEKDSSKTMSNTPMRLCAHIYFPSERNWFLYLVLGSWQLCDLTCLKQLKQAALVYVVFLKCILSNQDSTYFASQSSRMLLTVFEIFADHAHRVSREGVIRNCSASRYTFVTVKKPSTYKNNVVKFNNCQPFE